MGADIIAEDTMDTEGAADGFSSPALEGTGAEAAREATGTVAASAASAAGASTVAVPGVIGKQCRGTWGSSLFFQAPLICPQIG